MTPPPPLRRGDFVTLTAEGRTLPAMVGMASRNGRSIILMYDGIVGGFVGALPAFLDDAGEWAGLHGMPITIARGGRYEPE